MLVFLVNFLKISQKGRGWAERASLRASRDFVEKILRMSVGTSLCNFMKSWASMCEFSIGRLLNTPWFLWFSFAVLDRKSQNCTSKTSKNELENFVNIVKF